MHSIEIYGYGDQEICSGCEGHCGDCAPGAKKATRLLVSEFESLISKTDFSGDVRFYEATEENLRRNEDVRKILTMADLAPAIVLDGKLLFLGGFSPEGLVEEVKKRI
ncbi:hypothetical protein [Breznakiella homolactica]|uniref:Thioredoxin-like fold domain-containing protein n=1 Tax=Breznakiella homolactica TaxID=2798577 RepID=A0A7T7XMT5_9SPIR|nr:hypothetical protein [Breznakiella homolactica]QQO09240.1 hypothetical protein JFL75_20295 [Breznakiella homolactica]